jgi:hypothetical protein
MLALVDAKRDEYMDELDTVDARDLMDPDVTKWKWISDVVMSAGHSPCIRDHAMCKSKWHLLIPDYCRIGDYHARTWINREVYWMQSNREHVQEGLPRAFPQEIYDCIDEWFGRRPQIQPPHVRDLLCPGDSNFNVDKDYSDNEVELVDKKAEEESVDGQGFADSASPSANNGVGIAGCGKGMSPSSRQGSAPV